MARTRRIAVDQNLDWLFHYDFINEGDAIPPEEDFVVLSQESDYFGGMIPLYHSPEAAHSDITVWAVGLITFGPPTAEQIAFIADSGNDPDLSEFPGDYIASGFPHAQDDFQIGINYSVVLTLGIALTSTTITLPPAGAGQASGFRLGDHEFTNISGQSVTFELADLFVYDGTAADDTLVGPTAPATLRGLAGEDQLSAHGSGDRLQGGEGNDRLTGAAGDDTLLGGNGDDVLDTLAGGNDEVLGGAGSDLLVATIDSTFFVVPTGSSGQLGRVSYAGIERFELHGRTTADHIVGGQEADRLFGGAGFDVLEGSAGDDYLDAGAGGAASGLVDSFGSSIADAVAVDYFIAGSDDGNPETPIAGTFGGAGEFDEASGFEDRFYAFEVLSAGDTIDVEAALLFSGFESGSVGIRLFDSTGSEIASADFGNAFEQLQHEFQAPGTYYLELVISNFGFDEIPYFEFEAALSSTRPLVANRLAGGSGNDHYVVYAATDQVAELAGQGTGDRISSAVSYGLADGVDVETLGAISRTGTEAIDLTGNGIANRIVGNDGQNLLRGGGGDDRVEGFAGDDQLYGDAGDDVLRGGAGEDEMRGGLGHDIYYVDSPGDLVIEGANPGVDQVRASLDYVLGNHFEVLVLGGGARAGTGNELDNTIFGAGGADRLVGLLGHDILRGKNARDDLRGGGGRDLLDGGQGKDTMTGGSGRDTFQFRDGDFGTTRAVADVITDFDQGANEKIQFNLVDANTTAGGNQAFAWIGDAAFNGVAGQLRYTHVGGMTYVEGDTDGDGVADLVVALTGMIDLVAADFAL
jgi:Ca2+-binding RTX toxin-like protein